MQRQLPTLLPEMSTDEFVRLAKEAEKRALVEPEEKRKKRALYLSKIDYDRLSRHTLDFINNRVFTTTFLPLLNDENYVPHPACADFLNSTFALTTFNITVITNNEYHAKLIAQYNARVGIAKNAAELFNHLHGTLLTESDHAKQKESILKLEKQFYSLRDAYVQARKDGLLAAPAISKDTIQNTIANGMATLHLYASKITGAGDAFHIDRVGPGVVDTSYLSNPLEKEKEDISKLQQWQNEINKSHDQVASLIKMMKEYPVTICAWFAEILLATKKNVNFESACMKIKGQIEAELQKGDISQLEDAANLNYLQAVLPARIDDDEQPGSEVAADVAPLATAAKPKIQNGRTYQSQAATLSALVAHPPASRSRPVVELSIVPVPGAVEEKQQTPPSPSTPPSKSSQKSSGTPPLGPTSVTRQSDSATPIKLTATNSTFSYAGDKGKKPAQAADVEKSQSCCVVL